MLRLAYADRAEGLVGALVARLGDRTRKETLGALVPIDLLVPSRAVESWLKLELARRRGIAANLRFDFLERFLARAVEGDPLAPPPRRSAGGRAKIRVAGTDVLLTTILSALADPRVLARPELGAVRAYLDAATDDDALDLRRFQLATELARLFGDYQTARRDVLRAWRQRTTIDGPLAVVEAWQRALWLEVEARLERLAAGAPGSAPGNAPSNAGSAMFRPLADAFDAVPVEELTVPEELHVFGLRVPSAVTLSFLARIARRSDVFVYALNPVRHPWDDTGPGDTPALRLFGRAGRESVRLLNELTEGDFDDYYREPEARGAERSETSPESVPRRGPSGEARGAERSETSPESVPRRGPSGQVPSLLATLQDDVLDRRPERTESDREDTFLGDESITFLECPGARREVEAVAAEIWRLVREAEAAHAEHGTPPLRLNDIAVVLAGRETEVYRAHVGAVFHEHHAIPHHHLDVPIKSSSRVVEALELLLDLPFSGFTRNDLLKLVLHPTVSADLGEVDPLEWLRWLDALAVIHGADHGDHADTYIEKDLYNWDQGLKRLVLGTFMAGEASGDPGTFALGGAAYVPHEVSLDRLGGAAKLVVLVRSLVADARWLRGARMPLASWSKAILTLFTTYVGRPTEEDERDVRHCLSAIQALERLDATKEAVSFRVAAELVRSALSSLTTTRGQPLAEGVAVGTLGALAFLPFRVVFVTGLGEGEFPSAERKSQLDLRAHERRRGDVSARDEDEYLFLERLLATRERLYLSWVSRDARTGDELEPSTVVLALLHVLERGYVSKPHLVHHALRRWADAPLAGAALAVTVSPATRAEQAARALREDLLRALGAEPGAEGPTRVPDAGALKRVLPAEVFQPLARRLGLCPVPERTSKAEGAAIEGRTTLAVPQSALRRFLEDPAEGWVRYVLGLRDSDLFEDPLAREDERFETGVLEASIFLREVFTEKLALDARKEARSFEAIYDARAARLELLGVRPTGVFGVAERELHLELLGKWHRAITQRAGVGTRLEPAFRYGRAQENEEAVDVADPLVIDVDLPTRALRVELSGRTEPSVAGPGRPPTSVIPLLREKSGQTSRIQSEKDTLRAFVDHVVLAALGRSAGQRMGLALYADGKEFEVAFEPLSKAEAEVYLRTLLFDLLAEPHAYDLRFERVIQARERPDDDDTAPFGAQFGAPGGAPWAGRRRSGLPPLPRLSAEREAEVIERRFGAYFAARRYLA